MTEYSFETLEPAKVYVEIGKGSVDITTAETSTTTVRLSGDDLDQIEVRQDGDQISIIDPRRPTGFFRGAKNGHIEVEVTSPHGSQLRSKTGSADVQAHGSLAAMWVQTGSGDVAAETVTGPMTVVTGSGDVEADEVGGEFNVKTGSGNIELTNGGSDVNVATGSGDLLVDRARGAVGAKTGSGDLRIRDAGSDVSLATGSGDLVIDRAHTGNVRLNGASSDMHVGIVAGTPVWTDINTLTGSIHSDLRPVGAPGEGQDHVRLVARTVSGDITLEEV